MKNTNENFSRKLYGHVRWLVAAVMALGLGAAALAQAQLPTDTSVVWRNTNLRGQLGPCAFSPDGARLACGQQGKIVLLEAAGGEKVKTLGEDALGGFGGPVPALIEWSPDGAWLAVAGGEPGGFAPDNRIRIFDSRSGALLRQFDLGAPPVALAIGPRGDRLAAASFAGPGGALGNPFIRIWQQNGPRAPVQIKLEPMRTGNNVPGQLIAFDPKARVLAAGGAALTLWDIDTGQRKREVYRGRTRVASLVYNADGSLLAASTGDRRIRVWHTRDWQPAALLRWKPAAGAADDNPPQPRLRFTADGWLASTPASGKLRVWQIPERQLLSVQLPTSPSRSGTGARYAQHITWHDDHFVAAGGTGAIIGYRLQYHSRAKSAKTHDWRVARGGKTETLADTNALEAALPAELPHGVERVDVKSHRNSNGYANTTARYRSADGRFQLSIEQAGAARLKAYSQRMGAMVAKAPNISAIDYKGHTLYAGPDPGGSGGYRLMLFLDHFMIQVAGQVSEAHSRAVLDTLDLRALEASIADESA